MHSLKTKITLTNVKALKPQSVIWDTITRGFHARRQNSEAITYAVFFRSKIDGRQRFMRIGRHGTWKPDSARDRADEILRARDKGLDPAGALETLNASPDMNALLDDYEAVALAAKKATTVASDKSRIKTLRSKLGTLKAVAVTSKQVETFAAQLSPGGRRRSLALLSAIFNFAIKKKYLTSNPVVGVAKGVDQRKTRRISASEYAALGTALTGENNPAHDLILFLSLTGWRLSEGRLLRRADLDLPRQIANLSDSKSGASTRPLSRAAIDIINRQAPGDFVFGDLTRGAVSHAWRKLGLPADVTLHTCRHSYASLAADLGFGDSVIGGMIGHRQSSITSRYLHLDQKLIEAADAVAAETLRLMGRE
jgi:integrase